MGWNTYKTLAAIGAVLASTAGPANATAGSTPITVTPPQGLNLGGTSFFDGFGRTNAGWTFINCGRYEDLSRINGDQGNPNPLFKGTSINVFLLKPQLSYTSDWHPFGGDAVGFSAALPLLDFDSHFAQNSPVTLHNNGFGVGDLLWGPIYQSRFHVSDDGPYFAWRTQLVIQSPTGAIDKTKDLNQGSGFWAVNPFIAFTYLPFRRIEISNRLNYQYNFQTTKLSDPPPIPGLTYSSGQAGQLIFDNYDASFAITPRLFLGVAGYFVDQLNADKTNGQSIPHSLERDVYLGPGGRYVFNRSDALNVNLYIKVVSQNDVSGIKFNFLYVHRFP